MVPRFFADEGLDDLDVEIHIDVGTYTGNQGTHPRGGRHGYRERL